MIEILFFVFIKMCKEIYQINCGIKYENILRYMKHVNKLEQLGLGHVREFYVADKFDRVFAGYKDGDFNFSDDYDQAKTCNHPEQLKTLQRHLPELNVYMFYL
jgi:hypothetical protein